MHDTLPISADAHTPEILAPAGDSTCFLAALAAGADAIYLGLKHFSARMQADNFAVSDLARLTDLAHSEGVRVHVAMNVLLKPEDTASAYRLVARLVRDVHPDALIIQDPALLDLARQAGFTGGLHLSTLGNLTHPAALHEAQKLGASRVILPRELSIDEIRLMGEACPDGLDLECFVHGALCYCVSGRCYWSSYMGGKSGLRGRCVQPCRRVYTQGGASAMLAAAKYEKTPAKRSEQTRDKRAKGAYSSARDPRQRPERPRGKAHSGRYFSCLDLSLDVLAKTLHSVPHLRSWKIEGRKKGPHYVYHVVTAYRILRDNPQDSQSRKMAEEILQMALGRPVTRARFLPQKKNIPTAPDSQTSSGLLVGNIAFDAEAHPIIKPRIELLPKDFLRVGVEDENWHSTLPVTRRTPKAGTLPLRLPRHKTPKAGTPVYLIDRREPELMGILREWTSRLERLPKKESRAITSSPRLPQPVKARRRANIYLRATLPQGRETKGARSQLMGLWLTSKAVQEISRTIAARICWWLPPTLWPEEEATLMRNIRTLWQHGARNFVCNSPWQIAFFPQDDERDIIAGPFCNIANPAFLGILERMGFTAAFVSPELSGQEMLSLPAMSPLPLGVVVDGFWPVGIARVGLLGIKPNEPFVSPKGEIFWARQYGANIWIYPGWPLDISSKRAALEEAGYSFFAHMQETPPHDLPTLRREGLFNWEGSLL